MTEREWLMRGFPILGDSFAAHQDLCEQCQLYDASRPATLALLCLDGSVLFKREARAERKDG